MRRSTRPLIIASRKSLLARAQARMIGETLARVNPGVTIDYLWLESEGDQLPDQPLANAGGKGLFVRAVERALTEKRADLAVHSLKDMPAGDAQGELVIAAVPPRADVRDCLVSRSSAKSLAELPAGAVVGTSSPRRAAQVLRLRGSLRIEPIRGNIDTRLRKVTADAPDRGPYDATLLAVAGLERAGMGDRAVHPIDPADVLPAACQGALALQCRSDDHVTLRRCLPLNDPASSAAVHAERAVVAGLKGDCDSPIAVLCESLPAGEGAANLDGPKVRKGDPLIRLRARVLSPDGKRCAESDITAPARLTKHAVRQTLATLTQQGAKSILAASHTKPAKR